MSKRYNHVIATNFILSTTHWICSFNTKDQLNRNHKMIHILIIHNLDLWYLNHAYNIQMTSIACQVQRRQSIVIHSKWIRCSTRNSCCKTQSSVNYVFSPSQNGRKTYLHEKAIRTRSCLNPTSQPDAVVDLHETLHISPRLDMIQNSICKSCLKPKMIEAVPGW